jgi:DNA-directed DNA polymerase
VVQKIVYLRQLGYNGSMDKLMLLDGNSIFNRAYYALPVLNDKGGKNINAVYGFMNILVKAMTELNPTHIAVAFDKRGHNFRKDIYQGYKATRRPMPDDMARQMPVLQELLADMKIKTVDSAGVEADDIIGTLTKRFGVPTLIITGDKDMFQLVDEKTTVLLTKRGVSETEAVTPALLLENYGLKAEQVVEYKALRGDASDNIPGVKGIGEKGAVSLLLEYGTVDNIYAHIDEIKGALRTKLVEGKQSAYMSRELATIRTDADIPCRFEECERPKVYGAEVKKNFEWLEFRSLLKRLPVVGDVREQKLETEVIKITDTEELRQLARRSCDEVAIFIDENIYVSFEDGKEYEIPITHNFLDGIRYPEALEALKPLFGGEGGKIVYDSKSMKHALDEFGITLSNVKWDISIMQYLVEYRAFKELKALVERYEVAPHACGLRQLKEILAAQMEEAGVVRLYHEIEMPLAEVLFEMEKTGVAADTEVLNRLGAEYTAEIESVSEEIYSLAGERFNISSSMQLSRILFEKLGLPTYKKTKKGFSTDTEVLNKLMNLHPLVPLVLKYRQVTKLNSTYIEGIRPYVRDGVIHTKYNQTLTSTGRLSSSEPNLQNIPVRDEAGKEIRRMFVPQQDVLISADYSQIELRLLADFSRDASLIDAFNRGEDIHAIVAAEIFGIPKELVTANMRRNAKVVNFGIIYGMSDFGLSESIGVSVAKAREYIKTYYERYPTIKNYLNGNVEQARKTGYVTTITGRRRQIPEINSSNFQLRSFGERAAMNMPLQGSAADIIKLAMIRVNNLLVSGGYKSKLIMQIHDELIVDAAADEVDGVAALLKKEMEAVYVSEVRLDVNVSFGKNLFEAK